MRRKPCNFCGAPSSSIRDGKCDRCGTSYPKQCNRTSINSEATRRRKSKSQDEDANGMWANVVRELES